MLFLNRLRNWWIAKRRDLYCYWDGTKRRRADPVRISGMLEQVCPTYLDLLLAVTQDVSSIPLGTMRDAAIAAKAPAAKALVEATHKVFGLKPISDTDGVTDSEAIYILARYFTFMENLAEESRLFMRSP